MACWVEPQAAISGQDPIQNRIQLRQMKYQPEEISDARIVV